MKFALFNEYIDGMGTDEDRIYLNVDQISSVCQLGSEATEIRMSNGSVYTVFGDAGKLAEHIADTVIHHGKPITGRAVTIDDLELTARPDNCLREEGITTIEQLLDTPEIDLLKLPNMGKKSIREIKEQLAQHGLFLSKP